MKTLSANILDNFPNIELFYNLSYKKVSNYNLILAIPEGNKCFIWFTKIKKATHQFARLSLAMIIIPRIISLK